MIVVISVAAFHCRLQLFILVADERGGGIVADSQIVLPAVADIFFLPFGGKMIDVIEPAVFAALHLLDEYLFGIKFVL